MSSESLAGVVVPAFQAESTVGAVVREVLARWPDLPVVVVDDGSTDGTSKVAAAAGAEVVRLPANAGKGTALAAGLGVGIVREWTWAVTMDADGQHPPVEIERFLACNPSDGCGLVVGARDLHPRAMPFPRVCSNRLTTALLELQARRRIWDSQCGYRMYRLEAVRQARLPTHGRFEWESGALVRLAKAGWGIEKVDVSTVYADAGSHIHPWRDTARFVKLWFSLWKVVLARA